MVLRTLINPICMLRCAAKGDQVEDYIYSATMVAWKLNNLYIYSPHSKASNEMNIILFHVLTVPVHFT